MIRHCTEAGGEAAMKVPRKNITGFVFGRLTVVSFSRAVKTPAGYCSFRWTCRCQCGATVDVDVKSLRSGATKSCGCLRRDTSAEMSRIHGYVNTPEYRTWQGIKARCSNKKSSNYINYGGRGIKVCERWANSFENFFADMGEKPVGASIDRIDNNGDYEPGNCRWATRAEQACNTSRTHRIEWRGQTKSLTDWANELGFARKTLRARLSKMPAEEALTRPSRSSTSPNRQLTRKV